MVEAIRKTALRTIARESGCVRRGFTLVELMIIVALLGILAAIVMPMFSDSSEMARTETLSSNLQAIRLQIVSHSGTGDVPLSSGGYPAAIDPNWFRGGKLPAHAWTERPMILETVTAAASVIYPATKTFDPGAALAANAWYNATNGAFCVRVPAQGTDGTTLNLFNKINGGHVTVLTQTTE